MCKIRRVEKEPMYCGRRVQPLCILKRKKYRDCIKVIIWLFVRLLFFSVDGASRRLNQAPLLSTFYIDPFFFIIIIISSVAGVRAGVCVHRRGVIQRGSFMALQTTTHTHRQQPTVTRR